MNQLQRLIVWLRRMPKSRGFGVQSPSAYRFIRYVISEHYPYYAYAELRAAHPSIDWLARKKLELYFRVSNFRQADILIDYSLDSSHLAHYVNRGCHRTQVINAHTSDAHIADIASSQPKSRTVQISRICPIDGSEQFLSHVLTHSDTATLLIIEDIATSPTASRMWQQLIADPRISVSYDLYYLGIAFFDIERHKTNYIVNF